MTSLFLKFWIQPLDMTLISSLLALNLKTRTKCPIFPGSVTFPSWLGQWLLWNVIFPTAPECSRSPPSQIWLKRDVPTRSRARFPGGAAEGAGAERVCLFVRVSVCRRRSLCLSGTQTPSSFYGFHGLDTASAAMDPSLSSSCFHHWGTLLRWMLQCP